MPMLNPFQWKDPNDKTRKPLHSHLHSQWPSTLSEDKDTVEDLCQIIPSPRVNDLQSEDKQSPWPTAVNDKGAMKGTPACLPHDIINIIITLASDQQALHKWQKVSYSAYLISTPLLYSRPIVIWAGKSAASFFNGSTKRDQPRQVTAQLMSKREALSMVTALAILAEPWHRPEDLKYFHQSGISQFKNLKWLWLADHPNFSDSTLWSSFPCNKLIPWAQRLGLQRLQIGSAFDPTDFANEPRSTTCSHRMSTRSPLLRVDGPTAVRYLQPREAVIQMICHPESPRFAEPNSDSDTDTDGESNISTDCDMAKAYMSRIFKYILRQGRCSSVQVYGIGTLNIGTALYDAMLEQPGGALMVNSLDFPKVIDGDEAIRQALVSAVFESYIAQIVPHCDVQLAFRSQKEIGAFFIDDSDFQASEMAVDLEVVDDLL